ncbi:hypothetical protein SAMN05216223_12121 [Actinacidiphila yanglinensis]|uniref:Uncharacterized protein n=1 Tax=Actinacidiphila yanglinensis TaxID=310779 RepID=A0A1H6DX36_9ACTN|nr:DUF2157 domain-containing protein [Actinacidiphila yanglinensis]SEG89912.1 hypothetical protein SAMN05216223_12121 [Actinacidiphila yanglinensis]
MSWDGQNGSGGGGYGPPPPGGAGGPGAPDNPAGSGGYGSPGGYGAPPPVPPAPPAPPAGGGYGAPGSAYGAPGGVFGPPGSPGGFLPPPPPAPPRPPADALRAVGVALLNLSGLGLGYAFMRRWLGFAICLIASGILLVVALPAKPDGVSGGALVAYLVFLVLAAAHGAWRGLRTRLSWPPLAPVAIVLGVVLLAVPAGGVVLYDNARDNATQKMLLDRLAAADTKVAAAKGKDFASAQSQYKSALASYRDLKDHHSGSKAAHLVPDRMRTFYSTVAAPYDQKQYCDAVPPLKYLRTVPGSFGKDGLGSLATWPDDRLATSLYECGAADLESTDESAASGGDENDLGELLTTFPQSAQAAKVEPAVGSTIDKAAKAITGSDPCGATDKVRGLGSFASTLSGKANGSAASALTKDSTRANGHVESGTYACGVHEYKSGDFDTALTTMNDFASTYPHDKNHALAKKFSIAAEIAKEEAAAGKHVPTMASGGSIKLIVSNDSPDPVEILYTGKVTGSFTLPACGSCSDYSSEITAGGSACQASGKHYPKKTVYLPTGTIYILHKPSGGSTATAHADSETLSSGSYYTDCAYTVSSYGSF